MHLHVCTCTPLQCSGYRVHVHVGGMYILHLHVNTRYLHVLRHNYVTRYLSASSPGYYVAASNLKRHRFDVPELPT